MTKQARQLNNDGKAMTGRQARLTRSGGGGAFIAFEPALEWALECANDPPAEIGVTGVPAWSCITAPVSLRSGLMGKTASKLLTLPITGEKYEIDL